MSFLRFMPRFAQVSLSVLIGGCFNPTPPAGLGCSETQECPSGQQCINDICLTEPKTPDAGEFDAAPDAHEETCTLTTLATGEGTPVALSAVDSENIYWTSEATFHVLRTPRVGGGVEVFHDSGAGFHPYGLAVDSTHVYWSENDAEGRIMRKARTLGTLDAAEELATLQAGPRLIAIDATHVYWPSFDDGNIYRMLKGGGTVETIATGPAGAIAVQVDDTHVFWTNNNATTGQVMRSLKEGGAQQQLAGGQAGPHGLTLSDDTVYWTNDEGDEVVKVSKTGGGIQSIAEDQAGASGIVVNDTHLYWTTPDADIVTRLTLATGDTFEVAKGQSSVMAVAIDGDNVFWLNGTDPDNRLVHAVCQ